MSDLKYIVKFDDDSHIMTDSIFEYAMFNQSGGHLNVGKFLFKAFLIFAAIIMLFTFVCVLMK